MEPAIFILSLGVVLPFYFFELERRGECNVIFIVVYLALKSVVFHLDQLDCTIIPIPILPLKIIVFGSLEIELDFAVFLFRFLGVGCFP